MSILWDEKNFVELNEEDALKKILSVIVEFQKENASTIDSGSVFIGLTTGMDTEILKNLLTLSTENRSKLLQYIHKINPSKLEENNPKTSLKNLLLSSPHKGLEIPVERSTESGRDIQGWGI